MVVGILPKGVVKGLKAQRSVSQISQMCYQENSVYN